MPAVKKGFIPSMKIPLHTVYPDIRFIEKRNLFSRDQGKGLYRRMKLCYV